MRENPKRFFSWLTLFVFLMSCQTVLYADAWSDYQSVKATNRAQNQANMQKFRDGTMSADDIQREWDRIAKEEHEAAQKVEKEWKERGKEREQKAREKYEKDKKKQEEDAARRKQKAEEKIKRDREKMEERARKTREKAERDRKAEEERSRRVREEYEKNKDNPDYWKKLSEGWQKKKVAAGPPPSGRDMLAMDHQEKDQNREHYS